MRKKIGAIITTWLVTIAWWLRYYSTWSGSPIPSTYGANIDWTRHMIVQTGNIQYFKGFTLLTSYSGRQNDDLASFLYAMINIITGETQLVDALELLNAISLPGMILFPLIFITWWWTYRANSIKKTTGGLVLVVIFALYPSPTTIEKTAEGFFTETYATAILLLMFLLLVIAQQSKRILAVFLGLTFISTNVYHTWVFLSLLVLGVSIAISYSLEQWEFGRAKSTFSLWLLPAFFATFFISGTILNNTFFEFVDNLWRAISGINQGYEIYQVGNSPLTSTQRPSQLQSLNARQIIKLTNYVAGVGIISIFGITRLRALIYRKSGISRHDRVLFAALCSFPIIIAMFFGIGGISTAYTRTQYIGVYFIIFSSALLIQSNRQRIRRATAVLMIICIISAGVGTTMVGTLNPTHTVQQEDAIEWSGNKIPNDEYIFSETKMGTPLMHYQQKGVTLVRASSPGWEDRLRAIYYSDDPEAAREAIIETIELSKFEEAPDVDDYYIIMPEYITEEGVGMMAYSTIPTGRSPTEIFDRSQHLNRIYDSNSSTIYRS